MTDSNGDGDRTEKNSGVQPEKALPATTGSSPSKPAPASQTSPTSPVGSHRPAAGAPWGIIAGSWVAAVVLCVALQASGRELLAKTILAVVMVSVAVAALYLVRITGRTVAELKVVDAELKVARDQVVVAAMFARAELANLRERLSRRPDAEQAQNISIIVKSVPTIVSMFMAREKSLMKWGMAGFKLANSVYKYFNNKESS